MLTRYQRKKLMDSIEILDVFRHYNLRVIHDGMGRFKCHCPFHQDRTPSLKVYPKENSWWAYCCGKGTTVWDFLREKEGDFWKAEEVLKELATIELPEDPLDDLVNELREKTAEQHDQKIEAIAYLIGIALRDFLVENKSSECYSQSCEEVDSLYKELDDLLDCEDLEEQEMRAFQAKVSTHIEKKSKTI